MRARRVVYKLATPEVRVVVSKNVEGPMLKQTTWLISPVMLIGLISLGCAPPTEGGRVENDSRSLVKGIPMSQTDVNTHGLVAIYHGDASAHP